MKEEIWRDIEGYDGKYQISNLKNIRKTVLLKSFTRKVRLHTYEVVKLNDNGNKVNRSINALFNDSFHIHKSSKKVQMVISEFCHYYYIIEKDLKGRSRKEHLSRARNMAMKILREDIELSLSDVASVFNNRSHSAAISNIKSITNIIDTEPKIKEQYNDIKRILKLI